MKNVNKSWLIIIMLISLSIVVFLFIKQRKYSISEITADNFLELLEEPNLSPIYNVRIDQIIENRGGIAGSMFNSYFNLSLIPNENNNFIWFEKNDLGDTVITIVDAIRDLDYGIYRRNGHPASVWIGKAYRNQTILNKDEIRRILSEIITKCGFVIKKSVMISGNDILIREEEDCFRIVVLNGKYEDCSFIKILSYSRN